MSRDIVLATAPLGFPWQTLDPFLFCAHHDDAYPPGNDVLGPDPSLLRGRNIGMDFEVKDGFRMYHGDVVPGFPRHPHRGFETITIARKGFIDHSDSLGATARFGAGDVQWMTAAQGIVHSEMFPLVNRDAGNPTELFQIWLNLPRADKMEPAYFTMLWNETVPREVLVDDAGHQTEVTMIAGAFGDHPAPQPPPNSWAARSEAEVVVWTLEVPANASFTLPAGAADANRALYFFRGSTMRFAERTVERGNVVQVRPDVPLEVQNGGEPGELLLLHGRPIGEPVVQHGPFVMNTRAEIAQAMMDYQRTGFGDWPWSSDAPVHAGDRGRFAIHADGREDRPDPT